MATAAQEDSPSTLTLCSKCGLPVSAQFVRAIGGTFHLECFCCLDCNKVVATRFFPHEQDGQKYPLCERDYFRRLDLICASCDQALRGSYVTAIVFGPSETYYEHGEDVFCFHHYSIEHASICGGCRMPILKQYVEVKSGNNNEQWHPECYMIFKSWNIRLASSSNVSIRTMTSDELRLVQSVMDEKVNRTWTVLSAFEESAAACISDMLLHVSNQSFIDALGEAGNFIMHVEALFVGIDFLEADAAKFNDNIGLNFNREPKLLAKKIVNFFSVLSNTQDSNLRQNGAITQELLSLVTSLAQYLKILIRIALAGALKMERKFNVESAIGDFLNKLVELGEQQVDDESQSGLRFDQRYKLVDTEVKSDLCLSCKLSVEESCVRFGSFRWHKKCFVCHATQVNLSQTIDLARYYPADSYVFEVKHAPLGSKEGFEYVSQLEQYIFLLRVALKRLYGLLKVKDDSTSVSYSMLQSTGSLKAAEDEAEAAAVEISPVNASSPSAMDDFAKMPHFLEAGGDSDIETRQMSVEDLIYEKKLVNQSGPLSSVHNIVEEIGADGKIKTREADALGAATSQAINIAKKNDHSHSEDLGNIRSLSTSLPEMSENTPVERAKQETDEKWQVSASAPKMIAQRNAKGKATYLSEIGALETFVVSHLAVLRLHPLVQDHFTVNDLLDVVRNRKATFWTKILASLKPGKKPSKIKESGTFGVPLDALVEKYGTETKHGNGIGRVRIPLVIDIAITNMKNSNQLSMEGIFRKNGNIKNLSCLQQSLDENPTRINLDKENVIQLAALLKKFLRDLPEPLLTFKLHKIFILSQKAANLELKKKILHYCFCLLPKANRDMLEVLLIFLREVASLSEGQEGNKMTIANLATVIAPNILYNKPKEKTEISIKDESFLAIDAVKMLIQYQDEFWMIPQDISEIMASNELPISTDLPPKDLLKKYETVMMKKSNTHHDFRSNESVSMTAAASVPQQTLGQRTRIDDASSPIMSPKV